VADLFTIYVSVTVRYFERFYLTFVRHHCIIARKKWEKNFVAL